MYLYKDRKGNYWASGMEGIQTMTDQIGDIHFRKVACARSQMGLKKKQINLIKALTKFLQCGLRKQPLRKRHSLWIRM